MSFFAISCSLRLPMSRQRCDSEKHFEKKFEAFLVSGARKTKLVHCSGMPETSNDGQFWSNEVLVLTNCWTHWAARSAQWRGSTELLEKKHWNFLTLPTGGKKKILPGAFADQSATVVQCIGSSRLQVKPTPWVGSLVCWLVPNVRSSGTPSATAVCVEQDGGTSKTTTDLERCLPSWLRCAWRSRIEQAVRQTVVGWAATRVQWVLCCFLLAPLFGKKWPAEIVDNDPDRCRCRY